MTPSAPPASVRRRLSGALALPLVLALLTGPATLPAAALAPTEGAATGAVLPAEITTTDGVLLPDPSILASKLRAVSRSGIDQIGVIVTTPDGTVLNSRYGRTPLTPASTLKVPTTMAALEALGADRTFTTRVVDAGASGIVLVGGGDPLLTNSTSTSSYKAASLQNLAAQTVAALKAAGRTSVTLRYDASLFSGPLFAPTWKTSWLDTESRITALEINSGRLSNGSPSTNPARTAANAFAKRLRAAGIAVPSVVSGAAPAGATELGRVTSVPLARIVERTIRISDNVAAETLARHAALANGLPGSFAGAGANTTAWLSAKGLWTTGQHVYDGSGLSPGNKLTAATLAAAIRLALGDPRWASVIAGLPIAGETGTLRYRFDDPSERAGRHVVHAKTGTLSRIAGLAGFLTTRDGALLIFAELANKATSYYRAYDWLDRTAAAVARCGCR